MMTLMFLSSVEKLQIVESLCIVRVQLESDEVRLAGLVQLAPAMIQNSCITHTDVQIYSVGQKMAQCFICQ